MNVSVSASSLFCSLSCFCLCVGVAASNFIIWVDIPGLTPVLLFLPSSVVVVMVVFFQKKTKNCAWLFLSQVQLAYWVINFSSILLGHWVPGTDFEPGGEHMGPRDKAQQSQSDRAGSLAQGHSRGKHTAHNPGSAAELLPHSICHGQTCGCRLWRRTDILDIVCYFMSEPFVIMSI